MLATTLATLGLALLPSTLAAGNINLLPLPAQYTTGETVVCLDDLFHIRAMTPLPPDLTAAAVRMVRRLKEMKHSYLSVQHGNEFFEGDKGCGFVLAELELGIKDTEPIATYVSKPVEERMHNETYSLRIPIDGNSVIEADTALGALRALTTFENLFYNKEADDKWGGRYAPFAPYEIADKPAFGWRSVLLDTSRNFFSVDSIIKMLDTMLSVKLNVFHWHITDSHSWPLELSSLPELAQAGSYRGRVYTEDDVRYVVDYAAERGIDVVMEIDTPGHTSSIAESHPDYIACWGGDPWAEYANAPPAGQLRIANDTVTAFTSMIFDNASNLTKSVYFGTGGDEINLKCYEGDAETQDLLKQQNWNIEDALRQFTAVTHTTLRNKGRIPVVWDEMILDMGDLGLDPSTIVTAWQTDTAAVEVIAKGFRIIHAAASGLYLDCGHGAWIVKDGTPTSWCDPFKSWSKIYSFDPYLNITDENKSLVLGGQTSLWAEQTDEKNFEQVMWPRAAAFAEVFWTGATEENGGKFPLNPEAALPRMHDARFRMVERGVNAEPIQPEWCALRPGVCV